ncbi:MAG: primosomal protein N', partial [Terriglobales bacterium]
MPIFCDVALAVPLDMVFTYAIPAGMEPVVGGRVLVPFRQQRLSGIVVELHDRPPQVKLKKVIEALDVAAVLDEQLLKLGKWIADYYLAPVGEVFRTMLPLSAEFKRSITYRITDEGRMALHLAGMSGSPARSKRTPEQQLIEFHVLDYLAERESVREESLRGTTRVSKALLVGMVRKKWIAREDVSATRDATRLVKVAVLVAAEEREASPPLDGRDARHPTGKINENQRILIDTLAASGGRVSVEALRGLEVPRSTLSTLVRRGLIELVDEPQNFTASKLKPRQSPFEFEFSAAQKNALAKIGDAVGARKFAGLLLHGITGSGKTAVYLACMRQVLDQGRSSILLVPEIGLTPAVAADLHQVFGDEVAILHSGLSDAERAEQWHRIRRGEARVVAGTRSAVFAPVGDLALIIVDEEQDSSYKQEETPRYHARDVAVMRAKMAGAVVVLGSATPSLESYYNAKKNKYALVELPDRVEKRPLPEVEIVDMRQEFQETGKEQVISRKLAEEIRERLEKKEQVMVLLNRRGYSPVVLCRACGKTLQCKNCAVSMT